MKRHLITLAALLFANLAHAQAPLPLPVVPAPATQPDPSMVFLARMSAAIHLVKPGDVGYSIPSKKEECHLNVVWFYFDGQQSNIELELVNDTNSVVYQFSGMLPAISEASASPEFMFAKSFHQNDDVRKMVHQVIGMKNLPKFGLDGASVSIKDETVTLSHSKSPDHFTCNF